MSKLWGGRFANKKTNELADQFTFSISYDQKLAIYDVLGSIAHAEMLGEQGIIPQEDAQAIVTGLKAIAKEIEDGKFKINYKEEDIHSHIQNVLKKNIGDPADKLHTARSRNDQVVLDMKMYCLTQAGEMIELLSGLQKALVIFADYNKEVIVPAYTHLQSAQVVLLSHQLLAYVEMLERDKSRLEDAAIRMDAMPLGSCALSGSSLPTDRAQVTKLLGFTEPTRNSMDSVSDRDFVVEMISIVSIIGMHLSRMCEDWIIWSSQEFNFLDIKEEFCTGSSIMPHKKNPDVLELVRGTASKFPGHLTEILVLLKALPLTYNRDLQMDKPPLFSSVESCKDMLALMAQLVRGLRMKKSVVAKRVEDESFFTVDVMEYLIRKGVSYRDSHDLMGKIVKVCLDRGKKISDLSKEELEKFHPKLDEDVKKLLTAKASVEAKQSFGSTNPKLVAEQLSFWKKELKIQSRPNRSNRPTRSNRPNRRPNPKQKEAENA